MRRATWVNLFVLVALLVSSTAVGGLVYWAGYKDAALLAAAVVCLIPGRIQGYYYRDLNHGRRLNGEKRFEESLRHSMRFLDMIRERPNLKWMLKLGWSVYTDDVEAMALNNIGGARIGLGEWEIAAASLHEALAIDPDYAMPYRNLAVIAAAQKNEAEARRLFEEAVRRGLRGTTIDEILDPFRNHDAEHGGSGGTSSAPVPA